MIKNVVKHPQIGLLSSHFTNLTQERAVAPPPIILSEHSSTGLASFPLDALFGVLLGAISWQWQG